MATAEQRARENIDQRLQVGNSQKGRPWTSLTYAIKSLRTTRPLLGRLRVSRQPDIAAQVNEIYGGDRYWPEPLLQLSPHFERGPSIEELATKGEVVAATAAMFQIRNEHGELESLRLHTHQAQALAAAKQGESFVVTTGTGSGKSLCFFIPIVDAVVRARQAGSAQKTSAVIVYPMNALANSQLEEIEKFLGNVSPAPVSVARYTGQEREEKRRHIADNPPDILLTNFMMLEYLMTRQDELDKKVIGNCAGLRFLVLDELHTYRGRQGADVALLVRRLRARLAGEVFQCIGTSATMASGTSEARNEAVARVASSLFGVEIKPAQVIGETLRRVTQNTATYETVKGSLKAALDAGVSATITRQSSCLAIHFQFGSRQGSGSSDKVVNGYAQNRASFPMLWFFWPKLVERH